MNLIEALEVLNKPGVPGAAVFKVFLACGFTPLHLQTFLGAHLRQRLAQRRVEVKVGVFGDLVGNIDRSRQEELECLAVAVEWQDLDPRLGIRTLGGWRAEDIPDIVESARRAGFRLEGALRLAAASVPVFVCMPTLPLPPMFTPPTTRASQYELELRQSAASLATSLSKEPGVRVLNAQRLAELSPEASRFDVRSELATGFPYRVAHASAIAELLSVLIDNPVPKKGLITDLDDTMWAGILGEVGPEEISWHLDRHTQIHGVYQQFLNSLASAGILIAVASKNEPTLTEQAFEREDIIVSKDNIYPFEVHWSRKSESVGRILKQWNVGPEAVVFIDDSPMEVAEVKAAFPEMECVVFPKSDPQAAWGLLRNLRDLFGKSVVSEEDSLRLKSIRGARHLSELTNGEGASPDEFLRNASASIRFRLGAGDGGARALELVNKTNQFNLNGRRLSEGAWMEVLKDPEAFVLAAAYEDKYGPLGTIAVLVGRRDRRKLCVNTWVMSCRAFSRRIEHHCLKFLFERFSADEIFFDYQPTARNGPLQDFFEQLLGTRPQSDVRLSRERFFEKAPPLFHRIEEAGRDGRG